MTEDSFTSQAASLAGQACLLLGWRPDHFWAATPAELFAVTQSLSENTLPQTRPSPLTRAELSALMEQDCDG